MKLIHKTTESNHDYMFLKSFLVMRTPYNIILQINI